MKWRKGSINSSEANEVQHTFVRSVPTSRPSNAYHLAVHSMSFVYLDLYYRRDFASPPGVCHTMSIRMGLQRRMVMVLGNVP
jgi:hypothetical protein